VSKAGQQQKKIQVCVHWQGLPEPVFMGTLNVALSRGNEIFSFEYDPGWLKSQRAQVLDPNLLLFAGPQYPREDHPNFGVFLDSSPDRWGRLLMQRREAQRARQEERSVRTLLESDYLLGVYDGHRMGALRFRQSSRGPFLDNNTEMATPPWARLRDLEYASLQLEREDAENDKDYTKWLKLLIAPGGSLGGARPKAGVVDQNGDFWIAKFPSRRDDINIGGWEYVVHLLALNAGVEAGIARTQRFSGGFDTFLTRRFDRSETGERRHFASAMTLLGKKDGDSGETGVSYLDIAEFLIRNGAQVNKDLEQLWRRIVFNISVSNVDDHLRNHGFLLQKGGWTLSPAFDMNPSPTGDGLLLNISKQDNAQSLDLARSVAPFFRVKNDRAEGIISEVSRSIGEWRHIARQNGLPNREMDRMESAFRI
jgi:serine/threonine-protein kinase HipA